MSTPTDIEIRRALRGSRAPWPVDCFEQRLPGIVELVQQGHRMVEVV